MGSWAWLLLSLVCVPFVNANVVALAYDRLNLSVATAVGTDMLHDHAGLAD
jgi:hypothetical protein